MFSTFIYKLNIVSKLLDNIITSRTDIDEIIDIHSTLIGNMIVRLAQVKLSLNDVVQNDDTFSNIFLINMAEEIANQLSYLSDKVNSIRIDSSALTDLVKEVRNIMNQEVRAVQMVVQFDAFYDKLS